MTCLVLKLKQESMKFNIQSLKKQVPIDDAGTNAFVVCRLTGVGMEHSNQKWIRQCNSLLDFKKTHEIQN